MNPTRLPDQAPPDHDPQVIHDELIGILAQDGARREALEHAAKEILDERGDALYADLIWNLTNLRFEPAAATRHWQAVLTHKYLISEKLKRNVGISVAAVDYFTNVLKELRQPRVIDPELLERLYADATVDPLTRLPNRRGFHDHFITELARSRRHSLQFVLVIYDIDNFKHRNDTLGHAGGDRILREVGARLKESARESDLAARWGGEEFALIMPETGKREGALVADRIRERITAGVKTAVTTVSGGLAAYPEDGADEHALFSFADRALYRAKSEGKNRICLSPMERRNWPRLDSRLKVNITALQPEDGLIKTQTTNVSVAGVLFRHNEPLALGTRVRGEVEIEGRTITFIGQVVRLEEIQPGQVEIAIKFLEIESAAREFLMQYAN